MVPGFGAGADLTGARWALQRNWSSMIPPERLLKAQLLIALYSVRGDKLFCETLDYNILFRWFLDMGLEEPSFDASTLSKNRERLTT